eukprot:6473905-Amphidinium_carterae.6
MKGRQRQEMVQKVVNSAFVRSSGEGKKKPDLVLAAGTEPIFKDIAMHILEETVKGRSIDSSPYIGAT